jgi:hypothetical protein
VESSILTVPQLDHRLQALEIAVTPSNTTQQLSFESLLIPVVASKLKSKPSTIPTLDYRARINTCFVEHEATD